MLTNIKENLILQYHYCDIIIIIMQIVKHTLKETYKFLDMWYKIYYMLAIAIATN